MNLSAKHGGISQAERQAGVLDLSVGVSPLGIPALVRAAILEAELECYPDPTSGAGRRALAAWCGADPDAVLLGNGAAELLWTLARALTPGRRVLIWRPSFSEFETAARASGATIEYFTEFASGDRQSRFAEQGPSALQILLRSSTSPPDLVYLCAPASPLGTYVSFRHCLELAAEFERTMFVVDQSYLGLSRHAMELMIEAVPSNLVLVRSLTKELGLPGLRIGYALLSPKLVPAVLAQRASWTVSAAAEAAAIAYPRCQSELAANRRQLLQWSHALGVALSQLGCGVLLSDTLYCTAQVPTGFGSAAELRARLLQQQVAVRDCASFGLPGYFRVAAHPEQQRLLVALQSVLHAGERA